MNIIIYLLYIINYYLIYLLLKKYKILNYKNIIFLIILSNISFINYYFNNNGLIFLINYLLLIGIGLIAIIDIKEEIIPSFGLILIIISKILLFINNKLFNEIYAFSAFITSLFFGIIIILMMLLLKKELMGIGDLKLYTVLVLSYEIPFFFYLLFISSIIGIINVIILKQKKIPFGPSISIGYLLLELMLI